MHILFKITLLSTISINQMLYIKRKGRRLESPKHGRLFALASDLDFRKRVGGVQKPKSQNPRGEDNIRYNIREKCHFRILSLYEK